MNVLIASGGRRTSLVAAFKEAAHARGGKVFAGDIDGLAPALYSADCALRLPRIDSPDYIAFLLETVERERISVLIPTLDTELPLLAEARDVFEAAGCTLLISTPEFVAITGDKWKTGCTFGERCIRVPRAWLPRAAMSADLPERLFVKPRDGSASKHARPVSREELCKILPHTPNAIVQEELQGDELTIDALLDLSGRPIHYVPRRRIRTLSGESIQGVTVDDTEIRGWILRVLNVVRALGGRGPITIQAFLTPDGPVLSEINPRFGGGFPLAFQAGGRFPEWILAMCAGEEVASRLGDYQAGLYMTRSYTERFITEPLWKL